LTAPTVWRLTALAARILLAAIIPQPAIERLSHLALRRHLREPPRKRRYQCLPMLS